MAWKNRIAVSCLVAGVPPAAYGPSRSQFLPARAGLALVLGFWGLVWQWIADKAKPQTNIKSAAEAAWSTRDQPPPESPRK
jgi:formylglycine-generating enzyme required for sulfatase activity